MNTFHIERDGDKVMEGIRFSDGRAAVRWLSKHGSTAAYGSIFDVIAVHVDGHENTKFVLSQQDVGHGNSFDRGHEHAMLDKMENAPFGSVGGLKARETGLKVNEKYNIEDPDAYLEGYRLYCHTTYGPDWRTCAFGWRASMTIGQYPPPIDPVIVCTGTFEYERRLPTIGGFRYGDIVKVKEEAWAAYELQFQLGKLSRASIDQPIEEINRDGNIMLAWPRWWWRPEELELVKKG